MANIEIDYYYKFIPGVYKREPREHIDYNYAKKHFLKDYSYSIRGSTNKPLKILDLPAKNKFQIFIYNTILFFKFYLRGLFKNVKNK